MDVKINVSRWARVCQKTARMQLQLFTWSHSSQSPNIWFESDSQQNYIYNVNRILKSELGDYKWKWWQSSLPAIWRRIEFISAEGGQSVSRPFYFPENPHTLPRTGMGRCLKIIGICINNVKSIVKSAGGHRRTRGSNDHFHINVQMGSPF